MSETPWTKGPWRHDPQNGIMAISGPDNETIVGGCGCCSSPYGVSNDWDDPRNTANARLCAAAPELAEALEMARAFIVNGIEHGYIRLPEDKADPAHNTLPMIEAALNKARGT